MIPAAGNPEQAAHGARESAVTKSPSPSRGWHCRASVPPVSAGVTGCEMRYGPPTSTPGLGAFVILPSSPDGCAPTLSTLRSLASLAVP